MDEAAFVNCVIVENSLLSIAEYFESVDDVVLYVDRHVLDVDVSQPDEFLRRVAIAAAIQLARDWERSRHQLKRGVLVSSPVVIVDDDWLAGTANATPPHVWICLARERGELTTAPCAAVATPRAISGEPAIDLHLREGVSLGRVDSDDDAELPGVWVIGFAEAHSPPARAASSDD